jgi:hypothetical protein
MKRFILVAIAGALISSARAQDVSKEERDDGFVSLFNGKDFTGWRFSGGKKDTPPKNWDVAEGMIRLAGGGSPHLGSEWDYEDFDVRIQWKAYKKGYNSGFYIRSGRSVGANQINLAQRDCGHLLGGPKDAKAVPELQKDVGEWNDWRVLAVGNKLTFWANGTQAWEITNFKPARGYLGLQAEGAAIDFKNLRIKELGYESLNDPAKWKGDPKITDGAFVLEGKGKQLETKKGDYMHYVLRLEYKAAKPGVVRFAPRGTGLRSLSEGFSGVENPKKDNKADKAEYPPGQWNYLEVRVQNNFSSVWLNGTWLWEKDLLLEFPANSSIAIGTDGERLELRHLRNKVLPALPAEPKKE